ncbi:uncharacterized protein I303_104737 [Kwoniella dejecticola CBS 10117]|uniref:GRF-type domain-containing protein n=1 Tax=Kwoniella dejecticola CBS 10117 TaxID=1296121 RepID=A0A1A6A4H0_9TREE|nr:uncharacterized protein I303_04283 [Kwoniella dejecticola CBS 10117]OBR84957.1 hypothetical protein I303_04283 [Kwoniella dejecticola CBS 10117]
MASRTRTVGGSRVQNPTRTQLQPGTPVDETGDVKCTGHQMKCPKLRAGPKTKNAGRAFYCCPLPRDDPERCKFFKWHDEIFPLDTNGAGPSTPSGSTRASQLVQRTNQTLGQSPAARYGRPLGSGGLTTAASPLKPSVTRVQEPVFVEDDDDEENADEMEEIDWDKVDTEDLEREAIASTPASSQPTASQQYPNAATPGAGVSFKERLMNAAEDGLGKRRREEETLDVERTPKRSVQDPNPFLSSPATPRSPPHSVLSPTISSLEQISEHLHRQDRLLRAAEQMKKGMRTTIKSLQDRNKELEDKVKELEGRLNS